MGVGAVFLRQFAPLCREKLTLKLTLQQFELDLFLETDSLAGRRS
jgi:hypothetical protein